MNKYGYTPASALDLLTGNAHGEYPHDRHYSERQARYCSVCRQLKSQRLARKARRLANNPNGAEAAANDFLMLLGVLVWVLVPAGLVIWGLVALFNVVF